MHKNVWFPAWSGCNSVINKFYKLEWLEATSVVETFSLTRVR
jgi:hypothetical protein